MGVTVKHAEFFQNLVLISVVIENRTAEEKDKPDTTNVISSRVPRNMGHSKAAMLLLHTFYNIERSYNISQKLHTSLFFRKRCTYFVDEM